MDKMAPGSISRESRGNLVFPVDEGGVGSIAFEGLNRLKNFDHFNAVVGRMINGGGVGRRVNRR